MGYEKCGEKWGEKSGTRRVRREKWGEDIEKRRGYKCGKRLVEARKVEWRKVG